MLGLFVELWGDPRGGDSTSVGGIAQQGWVMEYPMGCWKQLRFRRGRGISGSGKEPGAAPEKQRPKDWLFSPGIRLDAEFVT